MQSFNKYLSIGLGVITLVLIIFCLSLRNSRDNAVSRLDQANDQINNLMNINQSQSKLISQLKADEEARRQYTADLNVQYRNTTKLIDSLFTKFKAVKRTNQQVNDWANTKLPEGAILMEIQPHQQRVIDEQDQLVDRLTKLNAFFDNPIFANIDKDEQLRLKKQASIMQQYVDVLKERIAAFI